MLELISRGLYDPYDESKYSRQALLYQGGKRLDRSISIFRPYEYKRLKDSLQQIASFDWFTLPATIQSIAHITQKGGSDEYTLSNIDKERKRLYLSQELTLGLPTLELAAEFLLQELSDGIEDGTKIQRIFIEDNSKNGQNALQGQIKEVLEAKTYPYQLNKLLDAILNFEAINLRPEPDSSCSELGDRYLRAIRHEFDEIKKQNPINLRERFLIPLEKIKEMRLKEIVCSPESTLDLLLGTNFSVTGLNDIYDTLKGMNVFNKLFYKNSRGLRISLHDGDIEGIVDYYVNREIIARGLIDFMNRPDRWHLYEEERLTIESKAFFKDLRDTIEEYSFALSNTKDSEEQQSIIRGLYALKESIAPASDILPDFIVIDRTIDEVIGSRIQ